MALSPKMTLSETRTTEVEIRITPTMISIKPEDVAKIFFILFLFWTAGRLSGGDAGQEERAVRDFSGINQK
jgi:hypothetical protein